MSLLRRRNPTKAKTVELSELRRRRDRLSGRLDGLLLDDRAAATRMRETLGLDSATDAEIDAATAARGRAAMILESVTEAIGEVDSEIAAAEERLAAEQDEVERQGLSAELKRRAAAIESAAENLQRAFRDVGKAHEQLLYAITTGALLESQVAGIWRSPVTIVDSLLLAGLRGVAANAAPWPESWPQPAPTDAAELARVELVIPLCDRAAAIRAGLAPAALPGAPALALMPAAAPPALTKITFDDVRTVLRESIQFVGAAGQPVQINEGGASLPEPVAAKAIELEIAFDPETAEAKQILAELARGEMSNSGQRRGPATPPEIVRRGPPWRPLPVNLYQLVEAERARLAERASA